MDISERVAAMVGMFLAFVPRLVGAVVVLLVGYIIAKIIQSLVRKSLQGVRVDQRLRMSDVGSYVQRITETPSKFAARVAYWAVMLGTIALAASALDLPVLNAFLAAVFGYVPQVIAALLILAVAGTVSAVAAAVASRTMGDTGTGKVAGVAIPSVVMTIAAFMALNQLGIARDIVNITFTALIGSLALGMALAFGLGGRSVAARILEDAYGQGQERIQQVREDLAMARERSQAYMPAMQDQPEDVREDEAEVEYEPVPRGGFRAQPTFGETLRVDDITPPENADTEDDRDSSTKRSI